MIRFRMFRIQTEQFAIIEEFLPDNENLGFEIGLNFRYADLGKRIACAMTFELYYLQKKVLILQVSCEFEIHEDDWDSLCKGDSVTIPKNTLEFFAIHTIGTARGILHCKTEGTSLNGIIIPPINVAEIIDKDIVINIKNKTQK